MIDEKQLVKDLQEVTKHLSKTDAEMYMDMLKYLIGRQPKVGEWITDETPPSDELVLVSFSNHPVADIGAYIEDKEGGAWYHSSLNWRFNSIGLFVNGWMPLPESCREDGEGNA